MSFFTQQGRTLLLAAVVMVVVACCLVGCGGGSLVGQWVDIEDGTAMELFKDGTGTIDNMNITWKVEGKRLALALGGMLTKTGDYKVSGYELTVSYPDEDKVWVREDKVDEYVGKNAEKFALKVAPGEARMVLKSYETSVLAATVEMGDKFTKKDLMFESPKDSKYFIYTVSEDGASCTATARIDIGDFKKGSTITIRYDKVKDDFVYSSSQLDVAKKLFPNIFANGNVEDGNSSTSTTPSGGGGQGDAAAELEKEATRWAKGGGGVTYEEEGAFFTFNGYAGEGMVFWTATGKKAIGDCPAGSEWVLRIDPEDGTKSSNFPPKCKSITPKVIIDFASGGSGGGNAMDFVKRGTEYLDRGDKNNNKADYDLAIAEFDRAIKLDQSIAAAYFGRGRGYLRKSDNSKAIADYSQALRLNPNDAISYSNRGRAYARMGDYDNAVADFESALRIDPNNAAIKQNLEKAKRREKGL